MIEINKNIMDKDIKKKVDKLIDSILKELGMSRKEFEEVKGIASKMKASRQIKLLTPTTIEMAILIVEVIVAQISVQKFIVPSAIVV